MQLGGLLELEFAHKLSCHIKAVGWESDAPMFKARLVGLLSGQASTVSLERLTDIMWKWKKWLSVSPTRGTDKHRVL